MADIKSAWEIAQEKASKLGELSAEEREGQRRDRCRLIGESLAEKYLSHHNISFLQDELNKQDKRDEDIISQAVVRRLVQSLDLEYPGELTDISQAILALARSSTEKKILDEIRALFYEYTEAVEKEKQEIEKAGREMMHQLRISGTAISQLNIRAKEEWQQRLNQNTQPFVERLNSLKKELLH